MRSCFGIEADLDQLDYSGRTDPRIARMLFAHYGIEESPERLQRFLEAYLASLPEEIRTGRVLPGIRDILAQVHASPAMVQGLLTGNLPRGAQAKLGHFDLWKYFPFGAFSDHSHDRNALGPRALQAAREYTGRTWTGEGVVVIGDTPHDIACARIIGARTVGVATGKHTVAQLQAAGADAVFTDFGDTDAFFNTISADLPA